ncbi:hypothetical protein [Paraflavitalea pollutisoli]|uniref:hypothetical protein n=1 Tax=Paraflavitalea pollutisoli TaxID=3034143 RepID=UPI0023EBC149|nr:hypothetical protein [Paraflavitalea sp. H1-2-19X]
MLLKVLRKALAVVLMLVIFTKYDQKMLLEYVTSNAYLQVILGAIIFVVAWELGKSRSSADLSPYVYRFLVRVFGDPKQRTGKPR